MFMDNMKDKYSMRFFLSLLFFIGIFVCIFFSIDYDLTYFVIVPLILIDFVTLFIVYQSLTYRLSLRNKHEIIVDKKINLEVEMSKKLESKKKNSKIIDKMFLYSLYASPIIIIISIALGVFVLDSVTLAIILPSFIISYLVVLFFVKDIYQGLDIIEEKEKKEVFIINKKAIIYKGNVYLINDCGFYFKNYNYKFLFIPISKPKFSDEDKLVIEEALNEIRNK